MTTYTLTDVTKQLERVIALNFAQAIWIKCELAQVNQSRGQYYLSLVQKNVATGEIAAAVQAILWHRTHQQLRRKLGGGLDAILQGGMEILIQVQVIYSERWGLSMHVQDVDPSYTLGQLELERQQTIATLARAGLLGKNRLIPLPLVSQRIAVISTIQAAGYQDFLQQLEHNDYGYVFEVVLFTAAMQGANVETEVLQQLKRIRRARIPYDVVVIIRGGGAKIELAAFDSLAIAETVARYPLPVLSGIGHEIDEVVLDKVAHKSLKTPTAVADFLLQHHLRFETQLLNTAAVVQQLTQQHIVRQQQQLQQLREQLRLSSQLPLVRAQQYIEQTAQQLPVIANRQVQQVRQQLRHWAQIVHLLSPDTTLRRGFAIIRQEDAPQSQLATLDDTRPITIEMQDGKLEVIRQIPKSKI